MNTKRDHLIEILHINYRTIKNNLLPLLTLVLGLLGTNQLYENMLKIGFFLLCTLIVVFSICSWYCKKFDFNAEKITLSEGVFRRKYQEIAINRVKSIHTSDSLPKRMLGISNLNVELIGGEEVSFVLSNKGIVEIKNTVFGEYDLEITDTASNNLTVLPCLLLAVTNPRIFWSAFVLTFTVVSFLYTPIARWVGIEGAEVEQKNVIESGRSVVEIPIEAWLAMIPIVCGLSILSTFVAAIYVFFMYKNYQITKIEKQIYISYGFFEKKDYQIPIQEIRSIRIIEPLSFRPFGYVQLKIDPIGMSTKTSRDLYFRPILKQKEVADVIKQYLPMFDVIEINRKAKKALLPDYLLKAIWSPTIILLAFIYLHPIFLYGSVILPFFLYVGYLRWKYAGLLFDDKFISHSEYKWLQSTKMITLKKYIQHTGISQSPLTKVRKASSYYYSVYSGNESYQLYGLSDEYQDQFITYPTFFAKKHQPPK